MRIIMAAGGLLAITACASAQVAPERVDVVGARPQPRIYVDGVPAESAPPQDNAVQAATTSTGPAIYVDGKLYVRSVEPTSSTGPAIYVDGRLVEPAGQ